MIPPFFPVSKRDTIAIVLIIGCLGWIVIEAVFYLLSRLVDHIKWVE